MSYITLYHCYSLSRGSNYVFYDRKCEWYVIYILPHLRHEDTFHEQHDVLVAHNRWVLFEIYKIIYKILLARVQYRYGKKSVAYLWYERKINLFALCWRSGPKWVILQISNLFGAMMPFIVPSILGAKGLWYLRKLAQRSHTFFWPYWPWRKGVTALLITLQYKADSRVSPL